jgi:enoyl-CoA hydratase
MTEFQTIDYRVEDSIAIIRHDRPEVRNAESSVLLEELKQAMTRAENDEAVRVIVLGGVGDHFSAGHDLKEAMHVTGIKPGSTVEERWAYESRYFYDYCLHILDVPKPTICTVQGACVSGGLMVANMCDLIIAADDAFFADPVTHSLATASVEVLIHPWVMGMRAAKEMLFTARRFDAQDALRCGMVNRVVTRADLERETMAMAAGIAAAPPFALRLVKRSLNRTMDIQGLRSALSAHFDTHQLSHLTTEFADTLAGGLDSSIAVAKSKSA